MIRPADWRYFPSIRWLAGLATGWLIFPLIGGIYFPVGGTSVRSPSGGSFRWLED